MKLHIAILTAAVAAAAIPASAAVTSYGDRTSFNTAAGATVNEDFQSCAGGSSVVGALSAASPGPCSSIAANISFAPDDGFDLYIAEAGQSANTTTALGVNFPQSGNNNISFTGGSLSFGADFNQNFGGGSQRGTPVLFTLDALDRFGGLLSTFDFSVPSGASVFFGITSDVLIGSIKVRSGDDGYAVLDDVAFAAVGGVPEASTWAMLIAGFGLVGAAMRRRATALVA